MMPLKRLTMSVLTTSKPGTPGFPNLLDGRGAEGQAIESWRRCRSSWANWLCW
jgi:hypothetical protein